MNDQPRSLDAGQLLSAILPAAYPKMGNAIVKHVQKVLDSAIANHERLTRHNSMIQKAAIFQSPQGYMRDSQLAARADRIKPAIHITKDDRRIRLEFHSLLVPGALCPTTDNPDEKAYLEKLFKEFVGQGVWLRFDHRWIEYPGDNSPDGINTFRAWLSFGKYGPEIPAPGGLITREALLSAVTVGKGYYSEVYDGPLMTKINELMKYVEKQTAAGRDLHETLVKFRNESAPGVRQVSDVLGGAKIPDIRLWDIPFEFLLNAKGNISDGKLEEACKVLVAATLSIDAISNRLNEYVIGSEIGAVRAAQILELLRRAGKVAECALLVYGLAAGISKFMGKRAAAKALTGQVKNYSPAAYAKTINNGPVARFKTAYYRIDEAPTIQRNAIGYNATVPDISLSNTVSINLGRITTLNLETEAGISAALEDKVIGKAFNNYIFNSMDLARKNAGIAWDLNKEVSKQAMKEVLERAVNIFGDLFAKLP